MSTHSHFIHPGIILREEFFEPLKISQRAAAQATGISRFRLKKLLAGESAITAEIALRLGAFFNYAPQALVNLQAHYDMAEAEAAFKKTRFHITPFTNSKNRTAADL